MAPAKLRRAINSFACQLYGGVSATSKKGNIILAPASVYGTLSMILCGARGDTAAEMKKVMGISEMMKALVIADEQAFHQKFSAVWGNIFKANPSFKVANQLWVQEKMEIDESFKTVLKEYYEAEIGLVDFINNPKDTKKKINNWISNQTEGIIKDLLAKAYVINQMRVLITNALYYKGSWIFPFKKTERGDFHTHDGMRKRVDMMYQKGDFEYTNCSEFACQILILKYKGSSEIMDGSKKGGFFRASLRSKKGGSFKAPVSSMGMLILLPNEMDGIEKLEEQILNEGDDVIYDWVSEAEKEKVEVYLPKFAIFQKSELLPSLRGMGIEKLFTSDVADLSGISPDALHASGFVHQVRIKIDEKGTEVLAASSSQNILGAGPKEETIFRADHPFLFCIYDVDTGIIVVWGRFSDPDK